MGGWGWGQNWASVRVQCAVRGAKLQVRPLTGAPSHLRAEGEAEVPHDHLPEDSGELLMREAQGPQPQVGGRVRDAAEDVLDAVDDLVDHHLGEVELLLVVLAVAVTRDAAAVVVLHEPLGALRVC